MYPGAFVIRLMPEVKNWLWDTQCRAVKSLDHDAAFWTLYKQHAPDSYLWGRFYWEKWREKALVDKGLAPNLMIQELLKGTYACPYDALLGPNEYVGDDCTEHHWHWAVAVEKQFAEAVRKAGKAYWALSMPSRNLPPDWVVEQLAPHVDGIALHLYSCDQPFWELPDLDRYAAFIKRCPVPVLIGEIGRDCLAERGWQQQRPEVNCVQYSGELQYAAADWDSGAYAHTPFAFGTTPDWAARGFEHVGCDKYRQLVKDYDYSGWIPPKKKEEPMFKQVKWHGRFEPMAQAMEAIGEKAGEPLNDAAYLGNDFCVQPSSEGWFFWTRMGDKGQFVKSDYEMGADGILHPKA